jgi:MFS family permease
MSAANHAFEVDPLGPPVTGRAPDIDIRIAQWSVPMASLVTESGVDGAVVHPAPTRKARRLFPWVVFTLTFALLLSDYMSRQVLSSVFPFLKLEWALTDTQLGALTSVVALTVGLLAVPLSLLGDRWGRVRSIVLMAVVWSLATAGSAIAANYEQLMLARVFIGVGEAAYGSVGLAVVLAVFPVYRRAALTGAFMAGGSFGSVLGVALGGALAVQFGWRWSFGAMAILGLVLVALYRLFISDKKLDAHRVDDVAEGEPVSAPGKRAPLRTLFSTPSVIYAYIGSGLQLFIAGSLFAWLPSYLNRAYGLAPDKAAGVAAIAILFMGVGMIVCGAVTDRLSRHVAIRKWTTAIVFSLVSLVCLGVGFSLLPGGAQLLLLAVGIFFAAGTTGAAGAMVSNLTHESIRATAFGTLTLANNLLGLAAGPLITGILADRFGLENAMKIVPMVAVGALVALYLGRRAYPASLAKVRATAVAR